MSSTDQQRDWGITTGIGITALAVAAGRAAETARQDRLCADPYADAFVEAARPPVPLPTRLHQLREQGWDAELTEAGEEMFGHIGIRTRFFDDFLTDAAEAGLRQVVILAAGLDTRAVRLDLPADTRVFEVDQRRVLEFKGEVLAARSARPRGQRRVVPVDLRDDWPAALVGAGFDPARPTAWLVEGLTPYLPEAAERALLERIASLSAPGSRVGTHDIPDVAGLMADERVQRLMAGFGFEPAGWFHDEPTRPGLADWFGAHGWTVTAEPAGDLSRRYHRDLTSIGEELNAGTRYLTTALPGPENPSLGSYADTDWDITTGVGFTALAVAAGRAMETRRPDALITDRHAADFVAAARTGSDGAAALLPSSWPPEVAGELRPLWETMATYMGVRTRFFDEYFDAACADGGIRQVVLLASGLDARAHRLDWPAGTRVFEIDHANVLAFKNHTLTSRGALARCEQHSVGVDLRDDWPAALIEAGFDPAAPTAWLAEGLVFFLPDEAKQLLFQRVQDLSAPGSRWAIEAMDDPAAATALMRDNELMRQMGDLFGADPAGLWPAEQSWEPRGWLLRQGWSVTAASAHTVAARYRRALEGAAPMAQREHPSVLLTATYEHPAGG